MKKLIDSDALANKINQLVIFINNIPNNTKGKKERYYIEDEIIDIKKLLKIEFDNINKSKHEKADKISMQSSIREMNGYFGTLIKTLSNKANVVNDLTLSQFLKQQSKRLNAWKSFEFQVTDSIKNSWTEG